MNVKKAETAENHAKAGYNRLRLAGNRTGNSGEGVKLKWAKIHLIFKSGFIQIAPKL